MGVTRKQLLAGGAALALAGCGAKKQDPPAKPRAGLDPAYRHFDAFLFAAHDQPVRDAIERHRRGFDQGAARRIEEWVGEAVAQGARVHLGGDRNGALVAPAVLTDVTPSMKVSCQELFGPLLTVTPYVRFEEALAALNDSEYGLQAGIFTQDVNKIFQAYRELEVGAVLANEIPTFRADHMPYGGVKDSGLGREGVRYAIEDMTELKLLVLNLKNVPPS